ncbi:MAG TPA: hypothetical protein VHO47_04285 [Candidatus Babeliales bacterium]|nr:hypothetical protein [Candidatus Babeliales bacterium]
MNVKQLLGIFFLSGSIVTAEESLFLKKLLFSKEIMCGTALLGAACYYNADYIKNKCTTYKEKTIWKQSSQTDFTSTGKEIVFSNDEIKKKMKSILMPGEVQEEYEFYDTNKRLIESTAPASPEMKDDEKILEHLSEIRIIPKRHGIERQMTVFKKIEDGQWIRKVITQVSEKSKIVEIDQKKEQSLLRIRKIVQGVGCGLILIRAARRLYNCLYS